MISQDKFKILAKGLSWLSYLTQKALSSNGIAVGSVKGNYQRIHL